MMRTITTIKEKRHYYIIRIPKEFTFSDLDYVTLAHEVLHITQYFLTDVLDRDVENEAEAYFHSYLMEYCLNVIRGKTK